MRMSRDSTVSTAALNLLCVGDVQGERRDALVGVGQRLACPGVHALRASPQGFLDQRLARCRGWPRSPALLCRRCSFCPPFGSDARIVRVGRGLRRGRGSRLPPRATATRRRSRRSTAKLDARWARRDDFWRAERFYLRRGVAPPSSRRLRDDVFNSDRFDCAGHGGQPGLRPGDRLGVARRGRRGGRRSPQRVSCSPRCATSWAARSRRWWPTPPTRSLRGRLIEQYRPDTLVLNAGAPPLMRPVQHHTWDTFSRNWDVDVRHAFHWIREALLLPLHPGSTVVTMSSGAAVAGSPLSGGYAGAKAAIRFITGYAADESERAGPRYPLHLAAAEADTGHRPRRRRRWRRTPAATASTSTTTWRASAPSSAPRTSARRPSTWWSRGSTGRERIC